MMKKDGIYVVVIAVLALVVVNMLIFSNVPFGRSHGMDMSHEGMNMDEMREHFVSLKSDIQGDMLNDGKYRCCLKKPCTYCIEKTPGHGEGAECDCLSDVVNGVHPCGECIGEILEGHGNPYLKEYFAEAIAEKTGELEAIQRIIDEKYPSA